MKKMIYNVFDGLVMLMMLVACVNALIAESACRSLAFLGLFAVGGAWLWLAQEVKQNADCN